MTNENEKHKTLKKQMAQTCEYLDKKYLDKEQLHKLLDRELKPVTLKDFDELKAILINVHTQLVHLTQQIKDLKED